VKLERPGQREVIARASSEHALIAFFRPATQKD